MLKQKVITTFALMIKYDETDDLLYVYLKDSKVYSSDFITEAIIVDYNETSLPVGVEVLNASKHVDEVKDLINELTTPSQKQTILKELARVI